MPILLTKMGERQALRDVPASLKERFTPLFVVPHVDWDYENGTWQHSIDAYLAKLPANLHQAWGSRPACIDLLLLDDDGPMNDGTHPLVWVTAAADALKMSLIPVVSPTRSKAYRAAVAAVAARDVRGICVRLQLSEWTLTAPGALEALLDELRVTPAEVDLVLDLADETGALAATVVLEELKALPLLTEWRSLVLAATSMPATLPGGTGIHVLPRREWPLYQQTLAAKPPRLVTFSDYAISNPSPGPDIDPRLMNISAALRYATSDGWLAAKGALFKGQGGRSKGGSAMQPVAATLPGHASYLGPTHCGCETWLGKVATGVSGGGNATVWRRQGTLHHLVLVVGQLATYHAGRAGP